MRVSGHGLSVDLPDGWEGRIRRRDGAGAVLHVASFALDAGDGDFGAAATGRMRAGDGFAALVEYRDPEQIRPGVGLFAAAGCPAAPTAHEFAASTLQVTRRGQLGWQRFFTDAGRPCCMYAVVQPAHGALERIVGELGRVLSSLRIGPV